MVIIKMNKNGKKRKTFLFGEMTNDSVQNVIKELLNFNNSNQDVYLYISSEGGDTSSGLALLDVMGIVKYDINTICIGEACSMASIILANGAEGKRWITENSKVMMHKGTLEIEGNIGEIKSTFDWFQQTEELLNKLVAKKTKKRVSTIEKDMAIADFWMDAKKAIKYRIVDDIWDKDREEESNS